MKELLLMSREEINIASVLDQVIAGELKVVAASIKLGITSRHVRRTLKAYKEHGPKALIHGLRGKRSNRATPQEILDLAIKLVKEKYWDFGPTFASEKLEQYDNLVINHDVLRLEMIRCGIRTAKKRKSKHRAWRERKEYFGEMVQFDGSHHRWFELRGRICCLLASKDDASNILFARLSVAEDIKGVFTFWIEYIRKYGKPKSIYLDKGSVYKVNHKTVFDDPEVLTQFERACKELGIEVIHAHSPQAKGRIENGFGTLQDRLVKELRLKNISDIDETNIYLEEFLEDYNDRFSVPSGKEGDLHTALIATEDLEQIFSVQSQRSVNNDFTVRFKNKWFQLNKVQPKTILQKSRVIIEERLNGDIKLRQKGFYLNYTLIPKQDLEALRKQRKEEKVYVLTSNPNMAREPKPSHPWRQSFNLTKPNVKTGHF